jgi:23S rRNA (uracil1939-C5)-methyltransferase
LTDVPDMSTSTEPSMEDAPTLRITGLAAGGDGLGRLEDGRVVFVEGGVPGDLVELQDLRFGKRMANARAGRVLEASLDRTMPRCSHFGSCGGCTWQHIRYAAQLEAKRGIVRDALERIGGLHLDQEVDIIGSPHAYGYRARARLVETSGGIGYRRRGSRECERVDECPILVPAAERKLLALNVEIGEQRDESAPRKRGRKDREWEILAGSDAHASARADRVGSRSQSGAPIEIEVLGESLRASEGSFVQGNALLWDALAEEVRTQSLDPSSASGSGIEEPSRFVELYAGIGFLTLPLVRAGCRGVVFESGRAALRDLATNLASAGFSDDVEIVGGRVEGRRDWAARFSRADLLLLDPPRVGLEASLRKTISEVGPRRVVYVSCDPATLARDLRQLVAGGYQVAHLRALDLFPQTAHVEVVVRLERKAAVPGDRSEAAL